MITNNIIRYTLIVFLLSAICMACRKDDFIDKEIEVPITEVIKVVDINGIVFDSNEEPLPGVEITINNRMSTSDENGVFLVRQADVSSLGSVATFKKAEYFETSRIIYPNTSEERIYIKLEMTSKGTAQKFQAAQGGLINFNGGAKVNFPTNSIVDNNGQVYSGEVSVFAHWYDPSDMDLGINSPASLEGIDRNEEERILQTFGMVGVELYSASGQSLQLDPDSEAELTFPIPADMLNDAPDEIPLWSLDEESGKWKEEFVANKVGNQYIGNVNHFSFWNCDAPFDLVVVSGVIESEEGTPLSNQIVVITLNNGVSSYGYTDNTGFFIGKMPKDALLTLTIPECGINSVDIEIGPFSSNTNIGTISAPILSSASTILASLKGCVGEALSGAYGLVNGYQLVSADSEGKINSVLTNCSNVSNQIKFYDGQEQNVSDVIDLDFALDVNDLGEIVVCEQLEEFISFSIDGEDFTLIEDPEAFIINGDKLHVKGSSVAGYSMKFEVEPIAGTGSFNPNNTEMSGPPTSSLPDGVYLWCSNTGTNTCEQFTVTVTEYDVASELVAGTFEGYLITGEDATGSYPQELFVEGSFRSKIVGEFDESSVSGKVWVDLNGNGTRDLDEEDATICGLSFTRDNSDGSPIDFGTRGVYSADGTYTFSGMAPGTYYLRIYDYNYQLTDFQSGDSSKDNDFFEPGGGILNYHSVSFTVTGGENIENLDLGLLAPTEVKGLFSSFGCEPEIRLRYYTNFGLKPFTAELSDGQVEVFDLSGEFDVLSGGNYSITVTDALGNSTIAVKEVESYSTSIAGRVWKDSPGEIEGLYESLLDASLENVEIRLFNSSDQLIDTQFSDNAGYVFRDLPYDDYYVEVVPPVGHSISIMNSDSFNGNDIDSGTARSQVVSIENCYNSARINAGFKAN